MPSFWGELTIQQERHTLINHRVNVTSELTGLRRCFKSRYDLVGGLEEAPYSNDAGGDGRMSGIRRMRG